MSWSAWLPWLPWLSVPVAMLIGWLAGRRGSEQSGGIRVSRLSSTYFRGLNYLLNEQQDKAIEVFLQIAEADRDTLETQLALGYLFRRRGEVDRAIRLHQNIVTRPNLTEDQRTRAILALGEDYMRAGLLDRAETLFADLARQGIFAPASLRHLIAIYQAERDWPQAIEHARRYERLTGESQASLVAHFYCELAETARLNGRVEEARRHLADARAADADSLRAALAEGRLEAGDGNDGTAIRAFVRAAQLDIEFLPEILPPVLACFDRVGDAGGARKFLLEMAEHYRGAAPALALAQRLEAEEGGAAAIEFLRQHLLRHPSIRGQAQLLDLTQRHPDASPTDLFGLMQTVTGQLIVRSPGYRCQHCGFGTRAHHWQCPSCKNWGTIKPLPHVVGGE